MRLDQNENGFEQISPWPGCPSRLALHSAFFGDFLQVNNLQKNTLFLFFFINVSSLESSSSTVRNVRSLPIPKLQSHMPKHLALWHPLLFSQEAKATLISCCTYSTYTVPKNYDKKRTDTTVTPAITQTHKMP